MEYFNSTTVTYSELGANAGLGYGGAMAIKKGTAWDMVGETSFVLKTLLLLHDQDLEESSDNPKVISGAEAELSLGFEIIRDPPFLKAEEALGVSFPTDVGFSFGLGAGITFSEKVFGISGALGIGATIKTGDQDDLVRSISLSYDESGKIAFGENWFSGLRKFHQDDQVSPAKVNQKKGSLGTYKRGDTLD
ncbi:hypothetical protein [Echinicola strongylocentroti]|uniref:hypothetical protein n=1 Tax=Echinicola strongylocentroti TaxID=1795355 RepID=UPI0013A6B433|nr:hypothetical protein [Echinicola strongylocentroti]